MKHKMGESEALLEDNSKNDFKKRHIHKSTVRKHLKAMGKEQRDLSRIDKHLIL